jgi:hypothetical protein
VTLALAGCSPSNRPGEASEVTLSFDQVRAAATDMLASIRTSAEQIAGFGSRQTGQVGCQKTYEFVKSAFADLDADCNAGHPTLKEFGSVVTVPLDRDAAGRGSDADEHTTLTVQGLAAGQQVWQVSAFYPNNVQDCLTRPGDDTPRRLVDLRMGDWEDFKGKSLADAVVLLDYNSGDAWLRARELGAYAAVFVEASWTNWRQSDLKYQAMVPIYMPRVYVEREQGIQLRQALADGKDVRLTVRTRLAWRNVKAPCVEFTVPGKDPGRTYILTSHFDARSIVPDLAYGGDEVWGISALVELARFFARPEHKPSVNVRFIAVSGSWQAQRCTRDYVAQGGPGFAEIGHPVQLVMGLDFSTEQPDLNLIRETNWDDINQQNYRWLKSAMFTEGGWHDQIYKGLDLPRRGAGFYADERPYMITTADGPMAPRNWLCPFTYAPKFRTANEAWAAVSVPTFAFQTAWLYRMSHNSPLDRFSVSSSPARVANLQPQLEMTLAVLDRLIQYPDKSIPPALALYKRRAGYNAYAQVRGRIQTWDPTTGWFSTQLPQATATADEQTRGGADKEQPQLQVLADNRHTAGGKTLRTFIYANSNDAGFYMNGAGRERGYLAWPLAPARRAHRELQSFMLDELRLLDEPDFRINAVHTPTVSAQIDVLGYTLDDQGRILYATDYGVHGDGNPAFQCTDIRVNTWDLFAPVTLFPCGSLELYDLIDIERWWYNYEVFGQYYVYYAWPGTHEDRGIQPFVRVKEVKNADSHTDMRSWGYVQYGPTAMVFLPARLPQDRGGEPLRAEVLLGDPITKFTPLLNTDETGAPRGYAVDQGQTIRVNAPDELAAAAYARQLYRFDGRRLEQFARQEVASPLANEYHEASKDLLDKAGAAMQARRWDAAWARYAWGWTAEVKAYQHTIRLLLDVVSTTVFYFTLLIPFSLLVERLIFPQTNAVRTSLVAGVVFLVFVGLLYVFHPGFHLANNILVTIIAFLIVVMTVPALILLLVRGVGMLKAMGSRAILLQRSEAEKAGVFSASLSLSVSNMRRRKLRTTLTLSTITTLVVALVLLTTSTAFEFSLTEPQEFSSTSFHGIQIYNTADHRNALLPEGVRAIEGLLADEALVLRREYVNYGYDADAENGGLYASVRGQKARVPYIQIFGLQDAEVRYRLPAADGQAAPQDITLKDLMHDKDGHPVWFDKDDVNVCLLPSSMAEQLGVRPGETIEFMSQPLTVLGVWESRTVKRDQAGRIALDPQGQPITSPGLLDRLTDLDAQPITPLKFAVVSQGDLNRPLHVASTDMIILPRRFQETHRILPANTWSLIVIPKELTRIPALAGELSKKVLNTDVFYRYTKDGKDRIEMISLRQSTKVKGSGMMFFMLLIAVLMILAIMMGTVHERMREITIFSSIGLAPRHVAGMFLIESLVYAGIASVLGYFIGIAALSFIAKAHLLPQGFYPNYLGVYVLYSIGMAMLATVASSLYPIRVAAQLVNPSLERSWQIDTVPQADTWRINLPFIATSQEEVRGILAYAYAFLAIHQGERSGQFVCQTPPQPAGEIGSPGVQMDVWLAPFERNITQYVLLRAEPGDKPGRWTFALYLERRSGPEYLWQRSNRAFVDALRKHLLNWRAMSGEQIDQFADQATHLFGAGVI